MKNGNLLRLVVGALLSALVMVATMFLKIPTATGYIHLGDGVIFGTALAFGPAIGATAGAIGSSLADLLSAYAIWAPWTFVIKGVAGMIVGFLGHGHKRSSQLISAIVASLWIIAGYAVGTAKMYSVAAVGAEILGNVVQTASGVVIGLYLGPVLQRALSRSQ
ncbi:MAG: ECF transporter S component [Bacillota bacterium]